MKFLFIDASRHGWGTEQHLVSLAIGLAAAGHGVVAVVKSGSIVERLLRDTAVEVHSTPFRGGADPRGLYAVARVIRQHSPDWLITERSKLYWSIWLLGRCMDVPVVAFRHLPYIRRWLTRCIFPKLADRFFVVSDFARAQLVRDGAPAANLLRLYNPIDTNRFKPDAQLRRQVRAELALKDDDILVGFAGRMDGCKGVLEASAALRTVMNRCNALHMLWVGDGNQSEQVRELARQTDHPQHHHFISWTSAIERYFAALDLLIAPSVGCETFGRVLAEAQCCGVPVIATNIGGMPEAFLPGRSGLLVDPGDAGGLAHAIARLAENPELRHSMSAVGREYALARFRTDDICREFVSKLALEPALTVGTAPAEALPT